MPPSTLTRSVDAQARSTPVPPDLRSNGLWAFESRHDPSFAMRITQHSFLKLLWIREGAGTLELQASGRACETGDLVLVPPRVRHRIIDSARAPISLYGLGVDVKRLPCVSAVLPGLEVGVYRGPQFRSLRIEQHLRRILYLIDQADPSSQLSSVATAIDLLAELMVALHPPKLRPCKSKGRAEAPLLEAYLVWLHRNFYEPLSLEQAAIASGMSRRTFTDRFKARTGTSWLDYVNALRIQHAEELLKHTDRQVTSIAFQCGFDDLSTFYRAFKRITGRNPGQLRP